MNESSVASYSDFAGFIDGFQARNLDSIQRNIALQFSEMQTRISVIKGQIQAVGAPLSTAANDFSQIDAAFRERSGTIVDRLVLVGERLTALLIQHGPLLKAQSPIQTQVKGLIRAYINAAEISRNDRMIDAALHLAEAFREMDAVPAG